MPQVCRLPYVFLSSNLVRSQLAITLKKLFNRTWQNNPPAVSIILEEQLHTECLVLLLSLPLSNVDSFSGAMERMKGADGEVIFPPSLALVTVSNRESGSN